jgi:SAM-dependent methyltransferase
MTMPDIDWNAEILEIQRKKRRDSSNSGTAFWNRRAPSFAKHAPETGYAENFLEMMKPEKSWSVLDFGCGGGTLALPLSPLVKSVTAVDFSENMIGIVRDRCDELGVTNVRTIQGAWEDDWNHLGIGLHDVAISSRSMSVVDYREAITKLDGAARKRVYISTVVGDGPRDRRLMEAVGRSIIPDIDYIWIYNLLHQMGIQANVGFIRENTPRSYADFEAAVEAHRWMFQDITPEEEEKLRAFLKEHLVRAGDAWSLDYARKHRWALIWWEKEQ